MLLSSAQTVSSSESLESIPRKYRISQDLPRHVRKFSRLRLKDFRYLSKQRRVQDLMMRVTLSVCSTILLDDNEPYIYYDGQVLRLDDLVVGENNDDVSVFRKGDVLFAYINGCLTNRKSGSGLGQIFGNVKSPLDPYQLTRGREK